MGWKIISSIYLYTICTVIFVREFMVITFLLSLLYPNLYLPPELIITRWDT